MHPSMPGKPSTWPGPQLKVSLKGPSEKELAQSGIENCAAVICKNARVRNTQVIAYMR